MRRVSHQRGRYEILRHDLNTRLEDSQDVGIAQDRSIKEAALVAALPLSRSVCQEVTPVRRGTRLEAAAQRVCFIIEGQLPSLQTGADQRGLSDCICSACQTDWRWWMCWRNGHKWFDLVADRSVWYLKRLSHCQQQAGVGAAGQDTPLKGANTRSSRTSQPNPSLVYFCSIYLLCTNLDTRCIPKKKERKNTENKSKMWNVKRKRILFAGVFPPQQTPIIYKADNKMLSKNTQEEAHGTDSLN